MASSSSSPSSSQAALSLASSLGLSLRRDWLEAAVAARAGTATLSSTTPMLSLPLNAEALISLALNADLNCAGAGGLLPGDLESLHGRALAGRRILQVDEVVNAAASAKHRYSGAPLNGRMLKLLLTDGARHVIAFEMEPVPALRADLPAGCKIALTDPLVLRGMLALRTANVAVLGGRVPRLEGAKERARAAWSKPPDGRTRWAAAAVAGGQENIRAGQGAGPTLYEKARAAAWPGAALVASAAHAAAAAVAPPLAPPSGPPRQPQQQEQQQNRAPLATVIFLDSSDDDEDVKMEAAGGGGGRGGADGSTEAEQRRRLPSFFPLPAAAGPAPASWPRRSLSEAAAAAAAAATGSSPPPPSQYSTRCLVRGSVVQAITALRFMDAGTGEALEGFGLAVELEESPVSGGDSGRSGTGSREEEEGFTALARCPAALSHAVVSGLLGGISTRDLVDQYAREGREAVMGKVSRVKAFFDGFDGWLGVEAAATETRRRKREEEEGSGGGAAAAAAAATTAPSLVVVGWWEA